MEEHRSVPELEGWAETLAQALRLDQSTGPVDCAMLERLLGERDVREAGESSWTLKDEVQGGNTPAELSLAPPKGIEVED